MLSASNKKSIAIQDRKSITKSILSLSTWQSQKPLIN